MENMEKELQEIMETAGITTEEITSNTTEAITPAETVKAGKGKGKAGKAGTAKELQETVKAITEEKEKEIKFIYGKGGQVWSNFPILLDPTDNPFIKDIMAGAQGGRQSAETLGQWAKENGQIKIIPIKAGEWTFYTVAITVQKQTIFKPWELEWRAQSEKFLQYSKAEEQPTGKQVKAGEILITNITTNRGKAINQAKALGKLFQWDYSKAEETAKGNWYSLTEGNKLQAHGKNSGNKQGTPENINLTKWQDWDGMVKEFQRV